MMEKACVIGALIGLCGAVNNNGKTEQTDAVIRAALLSDDTEAAVAAIHCEKYTISPNCASCPSPCGNTSDYDPALFDQAPADVRAVQQALVQRLVTLAGHTDGPLPDGVYKAISYLGYQLPAASYVELMEELKHDP